MELTGRYGLISAIDNKNNEPTKGVGSTHVGRIGELNILNRGTWDYDSLIFMDNYHGGMITSRIKLLEEDNSCGNMIHVKTENTTYTFKKVSD